MLLIWPNPNHLPQSVTTRLIFLYHSCGFTNYPSKLLILQFFPDILKAVKISPKYKFHSWFFRHKNYTFVHFFMEIWHTCPVIFYCFRHTFFSCLTEIFLCVHSTFHFCTRNTLSIQWNKNNFLVRLKSKKKHLEGEIIKGVNVEHNMCFKYRFYGTKFASRRFIVSFSNVFKPN